MSKEEGLTGSKSGTTIPRRYVHILLFKYGLLGDLRLGLWSKIGALLALVCFCGKNGSIWSSGRVLVAALNVGALVIEVWLSSSVLQHISTIGHERLFGIAIASIYGYMARHWSVGPRFFEKKMGGIGSCSGERDFRVALLDGALI